MFETFEKIKSLAKKQGISLNTLEDRVGLGKITFTVLKIKRLHLLNIYPKSLTTSMYLQTTYLVAQIILPSLIKKNNSFSKAKKSMLRNLPLLLCASMVNH